ncbi:PLP-dependent transferase [Escherichia coli]
MAMSRRCVVSWAGCRCLRWRNHSGGVESLISHAATMTHAGMAPEARAAAGISETLLRISTGIEDGEDLIADLGKWLRAANKG